MALQALLLTLAVFVGGVLGYLGITTLLMRRHVPRRSVGQFLRDMAREMLCIVLNQPLLPFFYVFGRRLSRGISGKADTSKPVVPVIVIHGYSQNRGNFLYLARELDRAGVGPIYGFNYLWLRGLPPIGVALERFIRRVLAETQAERVDLVCHSMGGLVAVAFLSTSPAPQLVRRCVTIATPHNGVAYTGPILGAAKQQLRLGLGLRAMPNVPFLSVYSIHDNVVFPASSSRVNDINVRNLELEGLGHLGVLFDRKVATAVAEFLSEPA